MDHHEPQVHTNSNSLAGEKKELGDYASRAGNILKIGANKISATALAGLLAITLAGCGANANAEGPKPTTSASAEPTPDATPTKTPEATNSAEHKFSGTIDLAAFIGEVWSNHESLEQRKACETFFDANIENRVALSLTSTGPEIAQSFKDKMLVLQDLVLDKSNELNHEAAMNIATCVSANLITNDGGNDGLAQIQEDLTAVRNSSVDGLSVVYIEPEKVTRYSDGTFPGQTDANDTYAAFAVEGKVVGKYGNLQVEYFKWVPDLEDYDFVLRTPLDDASVTPNFGPNPPIVVSQ